MKRTVRIILGCVYLFALLFSLIILIKPGAAIFYMKSQIHSQDLIGEGFTLKYQFTITNPFYNPDTILLLEDQHVISPTYFNYLRTPEGIQVTILLVPTPLANPSANEHIYSIYIRPYFISSNWGGMSFILLLIGLIAFLRANISDPRIQKVLPKSVFGVLLFKAHPISASIEEINPPTRMNVLKQSVIHSVLVAFLYVFMEWLFFVTKPSYMDILSLGEKVRILAITGFFVSFLSLLGLLFILLMDFVITPYCPSYRRYAYHLPFVFIASSLCLIIIDNFTYTIFKFGIVESRTIIRAFYALVFTSIFFNILREASAVKKHFSLKSPSRIQTFTAIILIISSLILTLINYKPGSNSTSLAGLNSSGIKTPNIILLGTDGLNADNMSVYGYSRGTTPFINELAKTSLLNANNFTNADKSTGSITSIFTGKLPFTTHVLYPPDILRGMDMYQHLPGLLKRYGYRTITLGEEYYIDANAVNFQNAFDAVNCVDNPTSRFRGYGYDDEIYFINTIAERIWKRINHIFFIQDMQNPYNSVMHTDSGSIKDGDRIKCLRIYLDDAFHIQQPIFAHIHMMATHAIVTTTSKNNISNDQNEDQSSSLDFYNERILGFDIQVEQLVRYLRDQGQFDNTIFILYTDHGKEHTTIEKIPLIMHFPYDQHVGTILENTQNLDIAPTILDYLGIQKPAWMEGESLLKALETNRLIVAGMKGNEDINSGTGALAGQELKPPFYQFNELSIIQCQNWYIFNLKDRSVNQGEVTNYSNPCSTAILDTEEVIQQKVGFLLTQLGYDLPDNW